MNFLENKLYSQNTLTQPICHLARCLRRLWAMEYVPLAIILLGYLVLNSYITFSARYDQYVFSDMFAYVNRPIQIYEGNESAINNWIGFAPFYSRVLAEPYSILRWIGMEQYFLEYILIQNMLMSLFSGVALYLIGRKFSLSRTFSLALTSLYLFSYPHLYFNGFALTEPFAVPLIIISSCMLLYWHNSYKVIFVAIALAIAVCIRPSNGLLGLPFALYIGFCGFSFKGKSFREIVAFLWPKWLRAALFSGVFFAVLIVVMAENNRISDGKMRGLTSHSGYNFLLGQTHAQRIISTWDGITYVFVPPATAHHPESGALRVDIPLYDSSAFFKEGWKVLEAYPHLWIEHLGRYKYLFFDNLFPAVPDHPGFVPLMEVFRYIVFYMFLISGLVYITVRESDVPRSVVAFFGAAFFLPAASLYFYSPDHKYFFNFSYSVYVLFSFAMLSIIRHFSKYKKLIFGYFLAILLGTAAFWFARYLSKVLIEENIAVSIVQSDGPVKGLGLPSKVAHEETIYVDELVFYERPQLQHSTLGRLDYRENFTMSATTQMEVLKDGTYTFTFFVDDGYEVYINGDRIMGVPGPTSMSDSQIFRTVELGKGVHELVVNMYQTRGASGLAGYYRREDLYEKPDVIWEPKGGRGLPIGIDDEFTRFRANPAE